MNGLLPRTNRRTLVRGPSVFACLAAVGCTSFRDFQERLADTGRTFTGSSYQDPEADSKITSRPLRT